MIHQIKVQDQVLAIIISHKFSAPGINFFTPNTYSQQVAYMRHPEGKIIQPHIHNHVVREVAYTQEVLIIKRGLLRVDFYNNYKEYVKSEVLESGDIIILVNGGHGFEVLEEVEMIEVKQGPYVGDQEKTKFVGITSKLATSSIQDLVAV